MIPGGSTSSAYKVSGKQKPGRQMGWAKIHSTRPDRRGALNVEWDSDTRILLCL